MCGGNIFKKIASIALPIIGTALGGPVGGAIGGGLGSAINGGSIGQDLLGAGLGGLGGGLSGATGSLVDAGSAIGGINSGISSFLSPVSQGLSSLFNSATSGLSDAAGSVGNGISDGLSNFGQATGLSSLFGGTPQPSANFMDAATGIGGPGAGLDIASGAGNSAPGFSGGAVAGGGASGAGFDLSNAGSAVGGAGGDALGVPSSSNLFSDAFNSSNGTSFGTPAANNPANFSDAFQAANPTGGSMSPLSSLFGGSGGGSSNLTNGLIKSAITGLLTNTNQKGYQGIASAANAAQADYQPFLTSGTAANNTLANLYGNNGAAAESGAQDNFRNTPGYQFALNQGIQAINADAARKGQLIGGNNQREIGNYATGTADQTYQNYVKNLQQQAGQGLSAAGGVGTAGLLGANALSQGSQANANLGNTVIGGLANGLFPSTFGSVNNGMPQWLSQLFGGSQQTYA